MSQIEHHGCGRGRHEATVRTNGAMVTVRSVARLTDDEALARALEILAKRERRRPRRAGAG